MKFIRVIPALLFLTANTGFAEVGNVPLALQLPDPIATGTPLPLKFFTTKFPRLELPNEPRPALRIPADAAILSTGKTVASSEPYPVIGELELITDGDKSGLDGSFVELGPGTQWIQIDLGATKKIDAVAVWRYNGEPDRVYNDAVVQLSNDPDFTEGVTTIFNNDDDNSSGLGVGKDRPYLDQFRGRVVDAKATEGRYVRCYSNGNTSNDMNHYIEVEVWGRGEEIRSQKSEVRNPYNPL